MAWRYNLYRLCAGKLGNYVLGKASKPYSKRSEPHRSQWEMFRNRFNVRFWAAGRRFGIGIELGFWV